MDYLTILATRCLIIFSATPPEPARPHEVGKALPSISSPSTPLHPIAITIPIESLVCPNPQLHYFLLKHVLSMYIRPSHAPKDITTEAEILVWTELDRGQNLVRALGSWFAREGRGITEAELRDLAEEYGLELKSEKDDWGTGEHDEEVEFGLGEVGNDTCVSLL
jgi:hypothetical protein